MDRFQKFSNELFHDSRWKLDWGFTSFNLLGIEFSVDLDKMTSINYNKQLPKVFSLIQQCWRRILTPIGRITVVKSFIIPKLNLLFISLPNPKQDVISSLIKSQFEYILKSKCDKVNREIGTLDYLKGGLKMVNISNFIASLQCSWIKKLTQGYKPWMNFFLSKINGNDFANKLIDFGDDFLSGMVVQRNNIFWQDGFNSWLCYTKKMIKSSLNTKNVFNIPVWYNSNIKIACKYVFIKDWYMKGIKIIGDFLMKMETYF